MIKKIFSKSRSWFGLKESARHIENMPDMDLPFAAPDININDEGLPKQDQTHPCASYTKLKQRFRDIGRENGIIEILGRDFLTAMPSGAYASRLGQISYLSRRMHEDMTSEEISRLLSEAKTHEFANPEKWDDWDRANIREMERLYRLHCSIPSSLMEKRARLSFEGRKRHVDILQSNDWERGKIFLQEQVELHRHIAGARSEANNEYSGKYPLYQALVEEYMPDTKVADIEKWFGDFDVALEDMMPWIIEEQSKKPDKIPLKTHYSPKGQMWLNRSLLSLIGFDFERGGLYETGHNPVEGGTPEDTRLVIKCVNEKNFLDSMKSALHEGGHGLYIQGLPRKEWRYQPVAMDLGAAIHESQALLIDMILGRTYEFCEYLSPRLEGLFNSLRDPALSPQNIYTMRNYVQPSCLRRNADAVTYFQHIKLRFEIERDLIEGKIEVDDLPEIWTNLMNKYVGIKPETNAQGCLQDVHWFVGKFGYFPAYALGYMIAAQLYYTIEEKMGDISGMVKQGNFIPIKNWLNDNIHSRGRLDTWDNLLRKATGAKLNPAFLVQHIRERYLQ